MIHRWGSLIAGTLIMLTAMGVAVYDGLDSVRVFDRLGPLGPGRSEPEFSLVDLEGTKLGSAQLTGSVQLLVFWATWCPYCRDELAEVNTVCAKVDDGVSCLAINHEGGGMDLLATRKRVSGYVEHEGLRLRVGLDDGSVGRAFGVSSIPHVVVVDRAGVIRFVHQGKVAGAKLQQEIAGLLAE